MVEQERIIKINIEEEMKSSYIDYSMSVIVSRALPDVRDGFKPVHRRILFGMNELSNTSDKPYKKSARIVGEVMGKYHPHGDSSVYNAMVRLAQEWSMRYCLVDGQGNFGSVDGDSPAAMRYTEARLKKLAEEVLRDIDKETVDFTNNFDDTLQEPTVMPTRIPNLLINGASGIAVGMATNMPPHNLSEVVDGIDAYIDNNDITTEELMQYIKAPDFPTGGYIYGYAGVKDAYETGRGRVIMRAKANIETDGHREKIVINEIPYMVNKAELIKTIADLVEDKKLEGISNINDESDRDGMRIVVDIKKDANSNVVLNKLFKMTALQTSFGVNAIALVHGRPQMLPLKQQIVHFVEHRHEVVMRRTQFELRKAQERAHILEGLVIAVDNIDEVIAIIKSSKSLEEARNRLMDRFSLSDIQSKAIVEMRLGQLTGLAIDKLHSDHADLMKQIAYYNEILSNLSLRMTIIKDELLEIKQKYGDERRTEIVYASEEFNPEDFYSDDEMIITISHMGYIKRTPLSEFRLQHRGGIGSKGSTTRDTDFVEFMYPASMHNYMLFFTQKGKCFWLKVYDIPEGAKNTKGRAIQNMLNIEPDDKVNAFIRVKQLLDPEFNTTHYLMFCTKNGIVKKTRLDAYAHPRQKGVNAIRLNEGDQVIQVRMTDGTNEIILANKYGRALRFNESKIRSCARYSLGVRGMRLASEEDEIVGMICMNAADQETILVVSENGYGKRSVLTDYRITNRGGKGVKTLSITDKTGNLVTIKNVSDDNDLMIINESGITIRVRVSNIRVIGRATQGVRLINLERRSDTIAAVCKVDSDPEEETEEVVNEIVELLPGEDIDLGEDDLEDDLQDDDTEDEPEESNS